MISCWKDIPPSVHYLDPEEILLLLLPQPSSQIPKEIACIQIINWLLRCLVRIYGDTKPTLLKILFVNNC